MKKKKKKKREEEKGSFNSLFYRVDEWTVLTIVGQPYSFTKLVRLLENHFEHFHQINSPK
jgi:hypothetical protein